MGTISLQSCSGILESTWNYKIKTMHPLLSLLGSNIRCLFKKLNWTLTLTCTQNFWIHTVLRSSILVITPIAISLRSVGVSGHGYSVALKLKTEIMYKFMFSKIDAVLMEFIDFKVIFTIMVQQRFFCSNEFYIFWTLIVNKFWSYPSQIFLTRDLSCSPWKKMMKTDLFTWSPWKGIIVNRVNQYSSTSLA